MLTAQCCLSEPTAAITITNQPWDLILLFADPLFYSDQAFIHRLQRQFSHSQIVGVSTAGEIHQHKVSEQTAVITAIQFTQGSSCRVASERCLTMQDAFQVGQQLGQQLQGQQLQAVLLFGKGVDMNGSALLEGIHSSIGNIPVSGGLAGDAGQFKQTWLLCDQVLDSHLVIAIGLYGAQLRISHGCAGGWRAFGPTRLVTKAEQNILFELDGHSALAIYKKYLGEYAEQLPASGLLFPFEMVDETGQSLGLIRTILGVDEQRGALILAGNVAQHGYLRLMQASIDDLIDGAETAAAQLNTATPITQQQLTILVSCVGRKLVMGDIVDDEVEAVMKHIRSDGAITGFYSYGEFSPIHGTLDCKLHNQTMTITTFSEQLDA